MAAITGLDIAIAGADIAVTGEGRFDGQSTTGKSVGRVLSAALAHTVPSMLIAGDVVSPFPGWSTALSSLAGSREAAMAEPTRWLREAGALAARSIQHGS